MLESKFQSGLIKELKERFPGCIVMKNDATQIQGIPDLTVLYGDKWAALECKRDEADVQKSQKRGNQPYYVKRMDEMSFARYIYPQNKKEVLDELELALKPNREACPVQS